MKCPRHHPHDGVGVCATCLHERLLAIAAVSNRSSSSQTSSHGALLSLPCSIASGSGSRRPSILSILSFLIGRSRSGGNRDRKPRRLNPWLSVIRYGFRLKKTTSLPSSVDEAAAARQARGMSPERCGEKCDAEQPREQWHRPTRASMKRATAEHHHRHPGTLTGFAMCFGPLVNASPGRRRSRVTEKSCSGDFQGTAVGPRHRQHAPAGGGEPELRHAPSRKLADFGKFR